MSHIQLTFNGVVNAIFWGSILFFAFVERRWPWDWKGNRKKKDIILRKRKNDWR